MTPATSNPTPSHCPEKGVIILKYNLTSVDGGIKIITGKRQFGHTLMSAAMEFEGAEKLTTTIKSQCMGTSLVAQWLGIRLPMQGTRVRALVREDPTCRGATRPVCHND